MRRHQPYTCGLGPALDVIGGKWKPLILWELSLQTCRFGQLRRRVTGISEKMLIQQLRELEADGIVHRKVFYEVPPRVEYSVTELGASLNEALEPLCAWGERHLERLTVGGRESCDAGGVDTTGSDLDSGNNGLPEAARIKI